MKKTRTRGQLGGAVAAAVAGVALTSPPQVTLAQTLLGNVNGGPTGGVAVPLASTWQQYSYSFTASQASTFITFLFENDSSFTALDDVSLVLNTTDTNLLLNGDLEASGGTGPSSNPLPQSWSAVYQDGVAAGGAWGSASAASPPTGPHGGSGYFADGTFDGFDGITQGVTLLVGKDYTLTFWLGGDLLPNGTSVDTQIYAGDIPNNVTLWASSTNIDTSQTSFAASGLGTTVNPVFQGGTLVLDQDGTIYTQDFTLDDSGTNTIDQAGNTSTFSGVFSNSGTAGGLIITNSSTGGAVILSGINTYTGATQVDAGATLQLSGDGSIAQSSGLIDNGTFDISNTNSGAAITTLSGSGSVVLGARQLTLTAASGTFSGVISGEGGFGISAGTETLTGTNTYSGLTGIGPDGTLALAGDGSIANSSTVIDNGAFDISNTNSGAAIINLTGAGSVVLGAKTLTISNASGTFSGVMAGTGGLTVSGGIETLTGTNTYTGATSIGSGATLALSGNGSIAMSSGVADAGTFDISNTNSGAAITTLSGSGSVVLGAQRLTLTAASGTFSGVISGEGGFGISAGTETLTGTNTYSGLTGIGPGGTLALAGDGSIVNASTVIDNGAFDISNTNSGAAINNLTGAGSVVLGAKTLTIGNASGTFSGVMAGTGGLTVSGGIETLTGTNTYTGATSIGSGATLALSGLGRIGSSSRVADGGTFDISNTASGAAIASLSGAGTVALGTRTLTLTSAGDTFSGVIGGTGGLALTGGNEALTGSNTYSGGTAIKNASLAINSDAALGNVSGPLSINNGSLVALGAIASSRTITLTGTALIDTNSTTVALSGPIGGAGTLGANGGGTLTLSGTNTYAGGSYVGPATTLIINSDGNLGAAGGPLLIAGGTLRTTGDVTSARSVGLVSAGTIDTNGHSDTLSGVISGSGTLTATGGGSLTLTGTNTYSGGTRIDGGTTLRAQSDASLGDAGGGVTFDNGTLVALSSFMTGRAITVDAGGGLIDANGNTLTLTGTIIQIGTLVTTGGGGGGLVSYGGPVTVDTLTVSDGGSSNSGTVTATTGGLVITGGTTAGMFTNNLGGVVNTGTAGIVVDNGGTLVNNGTISGGTLTLNGAGTIGSTGTITLTSTGTIGSTGFLSVNGLFGSSGLTVGSGGELRGTGTIAGPTTISGILAPGNSPGTLTFTSSVTQTASATTELDIDGTGTGTGAGNYSRVLVTGAGSSITVNGTLQPLLRGITGSATNTYVPPIGQQFVVISAQGGVLGSYATMAPANGQVTGLPAGTRFDAMYAPTTLTLVVTPSSYGNLGLAGLRETAGEAAIGRALDAIRPAPGLRAADYAGLFYPLYVLSGPQIAPALDQLSPSIYGSGLMAARETWYQIADAVSDQMAMRRYGMATANTVPGPKGTTIWVTGLGQFTDVTGSSAPSYHTQVGGAVAGIDIPLAPGAFAGLSVGGASVNTSSNGATDDGTAVQFTVYGGFQSGMFFVDGQGAYMHMDHDVRRNLGYWGSTARGSGTIGGGGVQVHTGLQLNVGRFRLEPTLGLSAIGLNGDAVTESSGGALAERISGHSITSVQSFAGMRVATQFALTPTIPLTVHALAGWQHEFADSKADVTAAFQLSSLSGFTVSSAPISRDAAKIGAGFDVVVSPAVSLFVDYRATLGSNMTAQYVSGGVKITW